MGFDYCDIGFQAVVSRTLGLLSDYLEQIFRRSTECRSLVVNPDWSLDETRISRHCDIDVMITCIVWNSGPLGILFAQEGSRRIGPEHGGDIFQLVHG